ncbi:NfeD family protein [Tundrisphaera lichenicola]|uniref:NfeD family protein n=1 Tax=Tundrisphaera lichenicola TaxID=2029860 RepID=UPI003EBCCDC1
MISTTICVIVLVIGLLLLVAEVFLPTAGLLILPASGLLGFCLYAAYSRSAELGHQFLVAEAVLVPSILAISLWAFSSLMRRPPLDEDSELDRDARDLGRLIGCPGLAVTPLRPSGKVEFEGRRLEGLAEQGLIPTGSTVLAIQVRSGRLIVREAPQASISDEAEG